MRAVDWTGEETGERRGGGARRVIYLEGYANVLVGGD